MNKVDAYERLQDLNLSPEIAQELELFLINNTNWSDKQLTNFLDILVSVRFDNSMIDQRGQGYDPDFDDDEW